MIPHELVRLGSSALVVSMYACVCDHVLRLVPSELEQLVDPIRTSGYVLSSKWSHPKDALSHIPHPNEQPLFQIYPTKDNGEGGLYVRISLQVEQILCD